MKVICRSNVTLSAVSAVLASAMSLVLSGCGMGLTSDSGLTSAVQTTTTSGLSGNVHGGPNPIANAKITLWETWTTGIAASGTSRKAASASTYGSVAYVVGSTTSDSSGKWSIPNFACDNGEYLYATSTGGATGSNAANPNEVLVAAIGACSTLPASVHIDISELSTVAVAYTLTPFLKEYSLTVGSGAQQVYIGAPPANNASAGGCTGSGATLSCTATGLGQAFANAISLVNAVSFTSQPTGAANTVPTDAFGNVENSSGSIPQALINTLGNVLQSCVNSAGGTAGDTSNCGKLFQATKTSTLTPTDTLMAAMNIARYPTQNVGTIYALAAPISSFLPALTKQPSDFSLAVTFNGSSNLVAFDTPKYVVLQPNETVTLLTQNSSQTIETLINLAPTGSVTSSSPQVTGLGQGILAVDFTGRLFADSPKGRVVNQYDASTLARTNQYSVTVPSGIAVDKNSTVYWSQVGSGSSVYSLAAGSTTPAQVTLLNAPGTDVTNSTSSPGMLSVDANQNLWLSMIGANNPQLDYVYETKVSSSTCTPPNFCGLAGYQPTTDRGSSYGTVFNSAGSAYAVINGTVYVLSNNTNGTVTRSNSRVLAAGDVFGFPSIDGLGKAIFPDHTSGALFVFDTGTNSSQALLPCSLRINGSSSQNTACNSAFATPINTQVDAAGAVWTADATTGVVAKIYGVGAPAWPALATGKPGVEPK